MQKPVREKTQKQLRSSMGSGFECKCFALTGKNPCPVANLWTISTNPWRIER